MKKTFLIAGTVTLVFSAILIACVAFFTSAEPKIKTPIAELIPKDILGWKCEDLPLAGTESLNETVNKILQFDQYIYRAYEKDNMQVTVYVAYWLPGKVTTTDAGVHNPDSCWLNSGWKRLERKHAVEASFGTRKLKPFEYGVYQNDKYALPVIFWHIVGDEVNRYESQKDGWRSGLMGRLDRLPLVLADLKKYGLNQRREQMFIRITANKSFDALFKNADFVRLLEALSPLGIFVESSPPPSPKAVPSEAIAAPN